LTNLSPPHTTPPSQIYTLPLHDALPISRDRAGTGRRSSHPCLSPGRIRRGRGTEREGQAREADGAAPASPTRTDLGGRPAVVPRSEEHTSELQSRVDLVCRLLLEKKK